MIQILLVGIQTRRYKQWKDNLLKAIDQQKDDFDLVEINTIDEIIELDVERTPSLIVNNKLELQRNNHIPDIKEFSEHLSKYQSNNSNNKEMKNMIVPTDLSTISANAYNYAKAIADITKNNIKVVNVIRPTPLADGIQIPDIEEVKVSREKELKRFLNRLNAPDSNTALMPPQTDQTVYTGFAVEEIVKISEEKNTDFILMGTTGEGGLFEKLLGSTSLKVSQKAYCPVWLIPPNATFNGIKNILFASNYNSADEKMIRHITNLATVFDSKIHLIHINEAKNKGDWVLEELFLEQIFNKKVPGYDFKMHTVQSETAWQGLLDFGQETNMDLIVIVTKHRSFWENLSHNSLTKQMVLNAKIPLLILHLDD